MTMLCNPDECTLLIIDTQVRLMPAIHDGETVIRRCVQLATAARELGIHVIGTEENPDGLGPLVPEIARALRHDAGQVPLLGRRRRRLPAPPAAGRDTLVVAGCEAHVCVLQTVIGLLDAGHAVKWVADAVGSRHPHDRLAATERARRHRRRRRHDRDGRLRVAGHQPASEVQAPVAAHPLSRVAGRFADPDDDPAADAAGHQRPGLRDRAVERDLLGDQVERRRHRGRAPAAARLPGAARAAPSTLSMPASVTPRRMNGMTVAGRSWPCARPQAATTPP